MEAGKFRIDLEGFAIICDGFVACPAERARGHHLVRAAELGAHEKAEPGFVDKIE